MPARTVEVKITGSTRDLEQALERAGYVAKQSGDKIGTAFNEGTSKAGGAISRLGKDAESFGVPFAGSLSLIGKHLDETTSKTQKLHSALSEAGKVTLIAGGAGLAAVGAEAIKLGTSYETAQAKIQASTNVSKKSAESLTHAFGQTAGSSMESGQKMEAAYAEVAGQLKVTEGHALSTAEAMRVSSAANDLSEGTATNLAAAYASVARTMQAFHLPATQAAQASDVLYNTSRALNMPVEQIATSMGRLHSRLGELAPSMGDIGGLMVALGGRGVQGSRGLQVVNTAFQTLIGGGKKTTEVLSDLGVHVFDQNGKFVGLQSVISQLQPKLAGLTQQQRLFAEQTLFGKGAAQIMGQVVMQGVPAFQHSTEAATRAGAAHQAAAAQMHTLSGEAKTLRAAAETLGGDLGLVLIPKLTAVAHVTSEVIQWFEKHKAAAEALAGVIATVLGAAVGAYVGGKAVAFVNATKGMAGALGALAGKITGTAAIMAEADGEMAANAEATAATVDGAMLSSGIGAALVALGFAAYELQGHWNEMLGDLERGTIRMANAVVTALNKVKEAAEIAAEGPIALRRLIPGGGGNVIPNIPGIGEGTSGPGIHEPAGPGSRREVEQANTNRAAYVRGVEKRYHLPHGILWGVYGNETSYGANITTSSAGAEGAFQFIPSTAAEYGYPMTNRPNEKQFNTQAQAAGLYLSRLIAQHHGDVHAALEAYSGQTPGYAEAAEQKAGSAPSNASIEQMMKEAASGKKAAHHTKVAALGIPSAVATMLATANALVGAPYMRGGGHGSSEWDPIATLKKIGIDCSGFVSRVLASGGLHNAAGLTTEGLPQVLAPGAGRYVTVYDRANAGMNSHTFMDILGKYYESGGRSGLGVHAMSSKEAGEEMAGGGFVAYHPAGLNAPVRGGLSQSAATTGSSAASLMSAAVAGEIKKREAELHHLESSGGSELQKLQNAVQTGNVRSLEKLLGARTAPWTNTLTGAHETYLTTAGSQQVKQLDALVSALRATHEKGLEKLASQLVAAHTQALSTLKTELVATHEKSEAEGLNLRAVELKDQTTITADMAAKVTESFKLASQQIVDWMSIAATALKDAGQSITDTFQAEATAIRDATAELTQASEAKVQAIQDQSKTVVDTLAERGLYGLNLVAQQEQVALDKTTTGYDQQIAQAQASIAHAQTATDKASAAAQAAVDAVTAQQDVFVGMATNALNATKIEQNQAIQNAQANLDRVTQATDRSVQEAQNAQERATGGTQAQQTAAQAALERAKAAQQVQVAEAESALHAAQNASASAIGSAENVLAQAQAHASVAEGEASNALATVHGNAEVVLANANQILAGVQGQAKVAEAEQTELIEKTKAQASTEYAGSGMQINIVGLNPTDGAVVASEVSWALLNRVPTPA